MKKPAENNIPPDLWKFIPMHEYSLPEIPTRAQVGSGASKLWRDLKSSPVFENDFVDGVVHLWKNLWSRPFGGENSRSAAKEQFSLLPPEMLGRLAPEPDWKDSGEALYKLVLEWLQDRRPDSSSWIRVIVGAPFSGTKESLYRVAAEQKWPVVAPPSSEEILGGGSEWLKSFVEIDSEPVVLPELEKCYLRHYNGLALISKLLDLLMSNKRFCLIGCSSWAWAYLSKALGMDILLPTPYTLEAFDGMRLRRWFTALARSSTNGNIMFRQADDGSPVLPPIHGGNGCERQDGCCWEENEGEPSEACLYLSQLASYSRGIPGVAWEVWRQSLRLNPDTHSREKAESMADTGSGRTIWVEPWSRLDFPEMPEERERSQLFVLQSLLLHDSLKPQLLRHLLSISTNDALESLHHMHQTGLLHVDMQKEEWQVTPGGYPVARQVLQRAGYLVDAI